MIPNDRCCPPGSLMAGWLGSTLSLTILKREEKKNWQNALSVYVMQWSSVHCSLTGITTHKSLFFLFLARASLPPDSTYVCITQPYSYLVKGHQLPQTACSVQPLTFFLFFGCKRWEVLFFWATFESKDARQTLSIKLNLPLPFFFFFWWI